MIINNEEKIFLIEGKEYHCAMDIAINYVGGKWKGVVLWYLRKDKKRFSELKKAIPAITEKMLSVQLRDLERDGIIEKTIYPEIPPRVEYYLSDFGKTLLPMIEEMARWGRMTGEMKGKIVNRHAKATGAE